MNVTYLRPSAKLLYSETQIAGNSNLWEYEKNCYFWKLYLLHLWKYLKNCFFTKSAAFPWKSTNLLLYKLCNIITLSSAPPEPIHKAILD